jgi:hypothetical protein
MLSVSGVSNNLFLNSSTVQMVPAVSAEWNQNLFNSPYITVAGTGVKETGVSIVSPNSVQAADDDSAHPYFDTYSFTTSSGQGSVSYNVTTQNSAPAYKIVTYMMTNSADPVMLNSYAKGSSTQNGSKAMDINSFGWTKIETYIGSSDILDTITSFTYKMQINTYSSDDTDPTIYFTTPEVYETTYFDYQYNSLWPTESVFTYFRPGESYVQSGDSKYILPTELRKVKTKVLNSQSVDVNKNVIDPPSFPISPIVENPSFSVVSAPYPFYKNVMPSDMSAYKYFVSDYATPSSISGIYGEDIVANKIVIKLNTILTSPTINVLIDDVAISVSSSTSITPDTNGLIILYATKQTNGSITWSKSKWNSMPKFNIDGTLSNYIKFKKITVTQINSEPKSLFSDYSTKSDDALNDMQRMQLIELSPRLEVDLSDYVIEVELNKSLDSKNSAVPISSINTDDASITLSAIPIITNNLIVPLFSSQSNLSINVLSSMLRKNIKFYINFNLIANFDPANGTLTDVNKYIPGGIYYSDTWNESDVKTVKIQCYDITRYLQTTPVPDYVANLKSVFDIITNILDLAGFTDYDYDSLYKVCKNNSTPMDMSYYYCNSKDTTVYGALAEIFLANQIGAYIDEYNVMRFLSLSQILSNKTSALSLNDSQIIEGGYQITNKSKPGKISVRYQSPKIKQSLALQNASSFPGQSTPSFIYTTSNDVVWSQQNLDSVGFNHLDENFSESSNKFKLNINDLLNIFHTYSLNSNGFAIIENEIVSFSDKEYTISDSKGSPSINISVKNDIELQAEINRYVRENESGLELSQLDENDNALKPINANITITPTGYITNVQRGLFGTPVSDHNIISSLTQKGLKEATANSSFVFTDHSDNTNTKIVNNKINDIFSNINVPSVEKIQMTAAANTKTIVYPNQTDQGYKTYSVKFDMADNPVGSAGLFFNATSGSSMESAYFVELIKFSSTDIAFNPTYKYIVAISQVVSGSSNVIAFAEITGTAYLILSNFEKIMYKIPNTSSNVVESTIATVTNSRSFIMDSTAGLIPKMYVQENSNIPKDTMISSVSGNTITLTKSVTSSAGDLLTFSPYTYQATSDQTFNLKVNHYYNDSISTKNGDESGQLIQVFLNNFEINGWQVPDSSLDPRDFYYGWKSIDKNAVTGLNKKIKIKDTNLNTISTNFGFFASTKPTSIGTKTQVYVGGLHLEIGDDLFTYPASSIKNVGSLREIYACEKLLNERSVSYWLQDREFLNGLVQNQNLFSKYKSYMMQTNPEVLGINYYDVQYTTPAAVLVDVLPIEYLWYYFPGNEPLDQQFYQSQVVDEYSLSYSTPINTGFRAKMAIANNTSHMVYLSKESDSLNQFTVKLNLWTHEIIAQSDPEIIEKVIDPSNIAEVIQLDSQWIQSKEVANKLLNTVQKGIEGFSKDTTVQIFGNPLIQVGDIITISYSLAALNSQKYIVHSVSQSFNQGLKTVLVLNSLDKGIQYGTPKVTGGILSSDSNYYYRTFLNNGTFKVSGSAITNAEALIIAGGGGGGAGGGGGGAGGVLHLSGLTIDIGSYPVVIGAGASASNGTDSSFISTATGGGRGGGHYSGYGSNGGSGGGSWGQGYYTPGLGIPGQGHDGGIGDSVYAFFWGGGGGGADITPFTGRSAPGGNGTNLYSTWASATATGDNGYYGGGGGGGWRYAGGSGGIGGIGGGGSVNQDGLQNTGGGGGGSTTNSFSSPPWGGKGGSGLCIIRWPK